MVIEYGIQRMARAPLYGRPPGSCAFSGCREPYARHALGLWPTCAVHASRIERDVVRSGAKP